VESIECDLAHVLGSREYEKVVAGPLVCSGATVISGVDYDGIPRQRDFAAPGNAGDVEVTLILMLCSEHCACH
jgi:hypothetical protein